MKTREQKIKKLEKKLAKLKEPRIDYCALNMFNWGTNLIEETVKTPYIKTSAPKLEIGKWYKYSCSGTDYLINCSKVNEYKNYGFSNGNWTINLTIKSSMDTADSGFNTEPATDKEVETALIKEAKKRGFKEGVGFKDSWSKESMNMKGDFSYHVDNGGDQVLTDDYSHIFINGKWAEIIEDVKPKINGYEMEVDGDVVKFGCQKFKVIDVKQLLIVNDSIGVTSFKIFGNSPSDYYEITTSELKEVVDYLNK